jgi:hypothetical protein
MLTRLSSASATEVGIYFGPQAICIGVPNGQLSRGLRTWQIADACVASKCEDDGTLSIRIKEMTSSEYKTFPCPEGEEITLSVSDGFAPDVRPTPPLQNVCSLTFVPLGITRAYECAQSDACMQELKKKWKRHDENAVQI